MNKLGTSSDFEVTPSATPDFNINIAPGTLFSNGKVISLNKSYTIPITPSGTSKTRKDYVALSIIDPNEPQVMLLMGISASSPKTPSIPKDVVLLAQLNVPTGTSVIMTSGTIVDIRPTLYVNTGIPGDLGATVSTDGTLSSNSTTLLPTQSAIVTYVASQIPSALPPNGSSGGDLSGTYPNPGVGKIQGYLVSTTAPTVGQVLTSDGTQWAPADPTGGSNNATELQSIPINSTAPTNGQVLTSDGSQWYPADSGGSSNATELQGVAISPLTPTMGQVLVYTAFGWAPFSLNEGSSNATELQSVAIDPATPTMGQGLVYNGFSWAPLTPSGGGGGGSSNATELQGVAISPETPTMGQVLVYTAFGWAPFSLNEGSSNATELQSVAIDPATPTMGQGLVYNGFSWAPLTPTPSGGGSSNATELQGVAIEQMIPTGGQALVYNGFSWTPQTPVVVQTVKLMNGSNYTLTTSDIGNIVVANIGGPYILNVDGQLAFTSPGQRVTLLIASEVTGITIEPGMGAAWLGGGTNPVLAGGATSGLQVTITFVLNDGTLNRFICG